MTTEAAVTVMPVPPALAVPTMTRAAPVCMACTDSHLAASVVIYYSNGFKYTDRVQSEDRVHRPGQTRTVTIYDIIAEGTVDESIEAALASKGDLAAWIQANPGAV